MNRPKARAIWLAAAAGLLLVGSSAMVADATSDDETGSVFVPTTPLRVLDTREDGAQFDTLGAGEIGTLDFTGIIPAGATAVDLNMTIVDGTQPSFLAVWPAGATKPDSSVLNWLGAGVDANAVSVRLGISDAVLISNAFGSVNVIADMMGYYVDAPAGAQGPAGPTGPAGPKGATGAKGATGDVGVADIEIVESTPTALVANVETTVTATCPSGKSVISGGFELETDIDALVGGLKSAPFGSNAWQVIATSTGADQDMTVSAVCATVASP